MRVVVVVDVDDDSARTDATGVITGRSLTLGDEFSARMNDETKLEMKTQSTLFFLLLFLLLLLRQRI